MFRKVSPIYIKTIVQVSHVIWELCQFYYVVVNSVEHHYYGDGAVEKVFFYYQRIGAALWFFSMLFYIKLVIFGQNFKV